METAWLLIAAAAVAAAAGVVAWRMRRRAHPRPAGRASRTPGAGSWRASGFPADPSAAVAATLQKDLLAALHRLPFTAVEGQPPGVSGPAHAAVVSQSVRQLQEVGQDVRHTPRRPGLLPLLMREVSDPDSSGARIARIVAQDPVLAGSLLRIANSALYRVQTRPVESLERAVASVGTDGIRRLVATALVQPVMGAPGEGVFGHLASLVWEHTGLASAAAAEHARRRSNGQAFVAQLTALMLGLGTAVVVRTVREQYLRRPSLSPDGEVVAALLHGWSVPTAGRIAAPWELTRQIGPTLEALGGDGSTAGPVGSLRFGSIAASLALLWRDTGLEEAEVLDRLATVEPDRELVSAVWKRLRRSLEDGSHG